LAGVSMRSWILCVISIGLRVCEANSCCKDNQGSSSRHGLA
jgi:hypothetical protein